VLGVRYRALDEAFATNLGIDTTEGALITEVLDDTPAAAAELMDGDIVIAVNDTAIDSQNDLSAIIRDFEDGDTVTLTVLRAGEEITLDVTLEVQDIGGQSIEIRPGGRIEGRRGLDPDGRGFGFRFDGDDFNFEDLEDFFDGFDGIEGFEGVLPPGASLSLTCQNSDGDTVFSFVFSGSDGFDIQNFQLPEMGDDGFDFESLDCQVNSDAPPAESGNGDL
jgi:membrane-associated protease RseP (regulator of RpoE activity)